ncbi:phosphoglycerate kinase, cytosolic-like protein isoform X1 [Tanacetum coccineum]
MVQRSLIEAIEDMLSLDGKTLNTISAAYFHVFLQSDIEAVALRMKQQFLKHGNGKFTVDHQEEWLVENPFGVQSDWEQDILGRGNYLNGLPNLSQVELQDNMLSGEFPVTDSVSQNLGQVSLSNNRLTGELPVNIRKLTGVQQLLLDGNRFSGSIH